MKHRLLELYKSDLPEVVTTQSCQLI